MALTPRPTTAVSSLPRRTAILPSVAAVVGVHRKLVTAWCCPGGRDVLQVTGRVAGVCLPVRRLIIAGVDAAAAAAPARTPHHRVGFLGLRRRHSRAILLRTAAVRRRPAMSRWRCRLVLYGVLETPRRRLQISAHCPIVAMLVVGSKSQSD